MEKNLEYTKMAYLYDKFYQNKNYKNEVEFIKSFIENKDALILDAGCGTGSHDKLLHDQGFNIFGFDLNKEMIEIANDKISNHFSVGNILTYKDNKKYDLIISFYAVFNHLKNYKEFETALQNLKSNLKEGGKIIIDLHNPLSKGSKTDEIDGAKRIMTWKPCPILHKEFTEIVYIVNGDKFTTKHTFFIFKLEKMKKIALKLGFKNFNAYSGYDVNKNATRKSKNIQIVLQN